jgi:hypothetical protein
MTTICARIRALHEAEPGLHRAELARLCMTKPQNVVRALGSGPARIAPTVPTVLPMYAHEFDACLRKMGVSRAWVARWLGVRPSWANKRVAGKVAVQPAEAALFRLLASGEISLDRVVSLSAASPEPSDGGEA